MFRTLSASTTPVAEACKKWVNRGLLRPKEKAPAGRLWLPLSPAGPVIPGRPHPDPPRDSQSGAEIIFQLSIALPKHFHCSWERLFIRPPTVIPIMKRFLSTTLCTLLILNLATPTEASEGRAELVGFHLGSEYFIVTREVDSEDIRARRVMLVLRCTFSDGAISGIDSKSLRLRIRPRGSTSGITYTSEDVTVFVSEVLSERSALVQFAFPYNLNVLGTDFEIEGRLDFILEEEERETKPIELQLTAGTRVDLEDFPIMISKVEIPSLRPEQISITFRMPKERIGANYSVEFFTEDMEPIGFRRSEQIIDNLHEGTFTLYQRPPKLLAVFQYVGISRSETLRFQLRAENRVTQSGIDGR
jgi:hypothetical protein